MAGPTFDVYVTGSRDAEPSGQMRLIAAIASRYRLSAEAVAAALDGDGACRVRERLSRAEADALLVALTALGAVARLCPAGAPLQPLPPPPPDVDVNPAPRKDGRVTLKSADAQPAVVDLSEPIDFAEPGPDGKTGVRGADTVRCSVHGLVYNRRQASGCLRCLAPARALARDLEESGPTASPRWGSFRDSPARRAFWGLAVALVVGFIPAAYHARSSTRRQVAALRAEQVALTAAPVTQASLTRFDELDGEARATHLRGAGGALLIWMVVAGATGAAWAKLT